MSHESDNMTLDQLQAKMNREPTQEEKEKIKKNLEIFENVFGKLTIEDGFAFLKDLRKEARRQKAMKAAERFEEQSREIEHVPDVPCNAYERQLADSFEIYEE
jgi:hypothetical protein